MIVQIVDVVNYRRDQTRVDERNYIAQTFVTYNLQKICRKQHGHQLIQTFFENGICRIVRHNNNKKFWGVSKTFENQDMCQIFCKRILQKNLKKFSFDTNRINAMKRIFAT